VELDQRRTYRLKELQDMAAPKGISLKYQPSNAVDECWPGKPKGLKQVLRERGLIDPNNLPRYSKDGRKDATTSKIMKETSYVHIMEDQLDFKNELLAIEWLCKRLGVRVGHSPKFHCEIGGEGIEYNWCTGKGEYRRRPLSAKKGMDKFRALARECFGPTVLTPEGKEVCSKSTSLHLYILRFGPDGPQE
jgi:hypothetical protein